MIDDNYDGKDNDKDFCLAYDYHSRRIRKSVTKLKRLGVGSYEIAEDFDLDKNAIFRLLEEWYGKPLDHHDLYEVLVYLGADIFDITKVLNIYASEKDDTLRTCQDKLKRIAEKHNIKLSEIPDFDDDIPF